MERQVRRLRVEPVTEREELLGGRDNRGEDAGSITSKKKCPLSPRSLRQPEKGMAAGARNWGLQASVRTKSVC